MMKKIVLFIMLFLCLALQAQQKNQVELIWKDGVKSSAGDVKINIPSFQGEYMDYRHDSKELFFAISIPASSGIRENSLEITNALYENITAAQLGDLSSAKLPLAINAKVKTATARGQQYAVITLSPVIKEGGAYRRLKSFGYNYQPDNTKSGSGNYKNNNIITNSVLASGEWHRFYVEKSGVYKVTRSFLQQMGVNVNVNPRNIKIYGNGGRMLPLLNSTEYPLDLAENAVTFIGEQDGVFNNEDYILFYAEGVDNWNAENGTHNNLYADRSYYYVTSQGGEGKRIGAMFQPSGGATVTTGLGDEYLFYEKDLVSVARLGRKWHGEQFNVNNEQNFEFALPDIEPSLPVAIRVSAAAKSAIPTTMAVKANGANLGSLTFTVPGESTEATDGNYTGTFNATDNATITLTYNNSGAPGSNAWLDFITLQYKRRLRGNGRQFRFQFNQSASNTGIIEYQFANAGSVGEVWDITDIYNVSKAINQGGQGTFSFRAGMGELRKYIAVSSSDYFTPLKESNAKVVNQNIKGTVFRNAQGQFQDIDYIIVAPEFLSSRAEKLANMHRTQSQLNVKVVKLENIYQEFSSGKQDIGAIRNFVKYVYTNASSEDKRVQYLNLFGDASFDYKNRIPNNTNIVPTLHAYNPNGGSNYSEVTTFMSDDFFGLMDDNEGPMLGGNTDRLDIAVGRMLVNNEQQADEMVNKVLEYTSEEAYGRWRNEYLLISDDLDNNGEQFVDKLEGIAASLVTGRPFINVRKIHSDSFIQEASAGGQRYPEARRQIINSLNYGTLVVNYLGHGGEEGMASERIFTRTDAQNLTNRFKYPLFITATCALTRFDNPYRQTAGEDLYWNSKGGAIAMITTTRSIYISTAFDISPVISNRLFALNPGDGGYPSMAEALRQAKVATNGSDNARVIGFVGDPALKLAIPRPKVILTEINGVPLAESTDVLEALSFIKLGGQVTDENGTLLSNYTGELAVTISDKEVQRSTLNNDGLPGDHIKQFTTLGETIFRGNASVNAGKFEFGFVVPRDIRIPVATGRASFYAKRKNILQDHTGYDLTIKVGGVNENAAADNTPPRIKLYMNEESFVSGGITNDSPILLALLEDENGLNTASGIGHDMIAILDGDETNQYILNDYYETELDNYKKGRLRFPFANLEKGLHTLTVNAWDVYNNPVSAEIQFTVVGNDALQIEKVLNYPNPFVSYTEFWFSHNRPFEPLDVQVQIFTITGKVVKTINQQIVTDGFLSRDIKWDGRDDFGDKIGKGVYVYKLTVRSSATNKTAEKYEKLVLL